MSNYAGGGAGFGGVILLSIGLGLGYIIFFIPAMPFLAISGLFTGKSAAKQYDEFWFGKKSEDN